MDGVLAVGDIGSWSLDAALDQLEALQLDKAALEAREQRLLARIEQLDRVENPDTGWHRDSVAAILRCAPVTARGKLAAAAVLVGQLPTTLDALACGRLTPAHVRVLLEAVTVLDPDTTAALEARVLPQADALSVAEFRQRCTRAVLTVDPGGAERRHTAAAAERHIAFHPAPDGMSDLIAHLTSAENARIRQQLDTRVAELQREHPGDGRGIDALRADAFLELCTAPGTLQLPEPTGTKPRRGPVPRPIEVTVAISTLLELDDHPGEIDGEPVAAALVRELAHDPCAWWRPVLIDRDGHLEALGARTYRPAAMLERTVKAHDRTCQFPGCRRRATRSETDHVVPFDHDNPTNGGLTVLANLHTLCKRHHRLKHQAGWTATRKDGTTHWRSPHGRRYTKPAHHYLDPAPAQPPDPPPY